MTHARSAAGQGSHGIHKRHKSCCLLSYRLAHFNEQNVTFPITPVLLCFTERYSRCRATDIRRTNFFVNSFDGIDDVTNIVSSSIFVPADAISSQIIYAYAYITLSLFDAALCLLSVLEDTRSEGLTVYSYRHSAVRCSTIVVSSLDGGNARIDREIDSLHFRPSPLISLIASRQCCCPWEISCPDYLSSSNRPVVRE